MTAVDNAICRWSATEQLAAMQRGEFSALELLRCTRAQFERIQPEINAVVTTDFDAAEDTARQSDARRASGEPLRPLEGLPIAVKDLEDTAGMRTTYGSRLYAHHVPSSDSLTVERMRAAGAVLYGKTNTPEFGTGSHTYNRVFGTTTNPYAPDRSAGGSSGGAAAALAAGLVSLADGSDMGGSLRNPASFCNVVGLRPSVGRVPQWPTRDAWESLSTNGPMGRTVADTALLFSVLTGDDPRVPFVIPKAMPATVSTRDTPLRVGWSRTLGGLDIEPEITEVLDAIGPATLHELGHAVTDVEPDLNAADTVFRTLRALIYARSFSSMIATSRAELGEELIANTEAGLRLSTDDIQGAIAGRTVVYANMMRLFEHIDVLAAPVVSVLPFPASTTWPRKINGIPQPDYLEWMRTNSRISVTGFTALSIPCGFSRSGLPIGLQLIAPPRQEETILTLASQFERLRPVWRQQPVVLDSAEPGLDHERPISAGMGSTQ